MSIKINEQTLKNVCELAVKYISENNDESIKNKSELWNMILDARDNYPTYKEFPTFIKDAKNYGTGNQKRTALEQKEFSYRTEFFINAYGLPEDFTNKIIEPSFGTPDLCIQRGKQFFSANYCRNMTNAYRIYEKYKNKSNVRILEIGPGTGLLSNILHQILDIKQYIFIDLPENLYLTSVYMQATIEKDIEYINEKENKLDKPLIFSLPKFIDKIDIEIDLVINTNSFGEIPLNIVQEYLKFIYKNLNNNGMVYSHNRIKTTHNKFGAQKLSDYLYGGFNINSVEANPSSISFYNASHIIMFLSKQEKKFDKSYMDVIGYFIYGGIKQDIYDLSNNILSSGLTDEEINFLDTFKLFFNEQDLHKKENILNRYEFIDLKLAHIVLYYKILIQFLNKQFNETLFNKYIQLNTSEAISYSSIIVLVIAVSHGHLTKDELYLNIKISNMYQYLADVESIINDATYKGFKAYINLLLK